MTEALLIRRERPDQPQVVLPRAALHEHSASRCAPRDDVPDAGGRDNGRSVCHGKRLV